MTCPDETPCANGSCAPTGQCCDGKPRCGDVCCEADETCLEDPGGRFARPEAGDPHLLGDLAVRPVEVGLEFVEGHLDVDADARRTEALDGALHGVTPRNWCSVGRGRGRAAATTTDRGGSPVRDVSATAGRFWSRV